MVVEGRGQYTHRGRGRGRGRKRNAPKRPPMPNRPSPTPLIGKIASLTRMDSRDQALDLLHDLARTVAPIMSAYGFKVGTLCEMFPKNGNLLGLNVNFGAKICIRLRPKHNQNWFLPMEELIGTMLHELAHNRCGPHNKKFYELLDELKEKYYEVQAKGSYNATGYLSEANRLGRASLPALGNSVREARLKKLTPKYKGKTAKLGTLSGQSSTVAPAPAKPMREIILQATERRLKDNRICPTELQDISEVVPDDKDLDVIDLTDPDARYPEVVVID